VIKCYWFDIEELVAPELLRVCSESVLWAMIGPTRCENLDRLRDTYSGPIWVNGNGLKYSGIRPLSCDIGASFSTHKMIDADMMGIDLHCGNLERLTDLIKKHNTELGIVRMENPAYTQTWRHTEFSATRRPLDLDIFIP